MAQAANNVVDSRRSALSPIVAALDGPAVDTAMAPEVMGTAPDMAPEMAPMMASETAPEAAMAPTVAALDGPAVDTTMAPEVMEQPQRWP